MMRDGCGMQEVFLSYAKGDRARAAQLAAALEAHGRSVWWDRQIPPGRTFDEVIEEALARARCVIVLWSAESVTSRWVRAEASMAAERGVLIPALIEDVALPLEFHRIQAANLVSWDGDAAAGDLRPLIDTVSQYIGAPRPAATSDATPRIVHRSGSARLLRQLGILMIVVIALAAGVWTISKYFERGLPLSDKDDARDATPATRQPDAAPRPNGPQQATAPPRATETAPADTIAISIGATVRDGEPKPGAGEIGEPFEQDTYAFDAKPRQRVFFRPIEQSQGMSDIGWRLVDRRGMEVFSTWIHQQPGVVTLVTGGRYTLTVGSKQSGATGLYSFALYDVPPPQRFDIRIGDTISDGVPGPGAGYIESPGAQDVYSFTATPRLQVQFRPITLGPAMGNLFWRLLDDTGAELFSTWIHVNPGIQTLTKGGTYTLFVGNTESAQTGTYEFQLMPVK
jgi:TIR domain